jgi:hypothetical protein
MEQNQLNAEARK